MRYLFSVIFTFVIVCSGAFCVSAENLPQMTLSAQTQKADRLFDVYITLDDEDVVCGGKITLSYDSKMIEYRDIKSENFEVEIDDDQGVIEIAFASCDDSDFDDTIAVLTFKGVSVGTSVMGFEKVECIDSEFDQVGVDTFGLDINVTKSSVSAKTRTAKESVVSHKSEVTYIDDNNTSTVDSVDISKAQSYRIDTTWVLGGLFAASALFVLGYIVAKKTKR